MVSPAYHEATKHDFGRFARALGYLDWATQPDPFRRFAGAALIDLPREPLARDVTYDALYDGTAPSRPIGLPTIGEFLRCSMGLSAWKQYGASRWPLRVNPSSGNLHPTETYVVWNGRVCHYAVREHALEIRSASREGSRRIKPSSELDPVVTPSDAARTFTVSESSFLVGLTSIYWREAWKYGERAFRYCQHDTGHAIGALRLSAAMMGWRLALLPRWSHEDMASVLGVGRDEDFEGAEREDPECIAVVTAGDPAPFLDANPALWVDAWRRAAWQGRASRVSPDHVDWPLIDEVAAATHDPGDQSRRCGADLYGPRESRGPKGPGRHLAESRVAARDIILQRRSALAFDPGAPPLSREAFMSMLGRLQPGAPPCDAMGWPPQVHLAIFVHRVEGLVPGLYAYLRDPAVLAEWKAAMRPEFLWERVNDRNGPNDPGDPNAPNVPNDLFLLVPIDCRQMAKRVSCDQDIAADGFFGLGMIARMEAPLREQGEWMYRRLFWECGLIGQALYLEAEAAGARATGIGCYYDDPMHELLGLTGHLWQSLYHFSMGTPIEDTRLTTEPGYSWE